MGQLANVQWYPPDEQKNSNEGAAFGQGVWWGASGARGRREYMEDTSFTLPSLGPFASSAQQRAEWNGTSAFGVFDGHGGKVAATMCEKDLPAFIANSPGQDVGAALVNAFHHADGHLARMDHGDSGSCALVCCVRSDTLFVANAGDCRAVLCRNGQAIDLSVDHKPELEQEQERIEAAGGWVEQDDPSDIARVNGNLGVARAIGDLSMKQNPALPAHQQIIIPTPEVEVVQRSPKDEFMILACDGVWDVLSSDAAVDKVRRWLGRRSDMEERLHSGDLSLQDVAEKLLDHCLRPRLQLLSDIGTDNMTVVIIVFAKSFSSKQPSFGS